MIFDIILAATNHSSYSFWNIINHLIKSIFDINLFFVTFLLLKKSILLKDTFFCHGLVYLKLIADNICFDLNSLYSNSFLDVLTY